MLIKYMYISTIHDPMKRRNVHVLCQLEDIFKLANNMCANCTFKIFSLSSVITHDPAHLRMHAFTFQNTAIHQLYLQDIYVVRSQRQICVKSIKRLYNQSLHWGK